jgi:hypothetical protein
MSTRLRRFRKPPPEGWELIEPTIEEFDSKMREAESESHEGKRKVEALWPIFRLHHQRSRYIYELYYKRKAISKGRWLAGGHVCTTHLILQNYMSFASYKRSQTPR